MNELFANLFRVSHLERQTDVESARFVYGIATIMFIGTLLGTFLVPSGDGLPTFFSALQNGNTLAAINGIALLAVGLGSFLLVRQNQLRIASLLIISILVLRIATSEELQFTSGLIYITVCGAIILTALLLEERDALVASASAIVAYIISYFVTQQAVANSNFFGVVIGFIAFTGIALLFIRVRRISRTEGQKVEGEQRLRLAEINSKITSQASERIVLEQALINALQLILDNYKEIYHAQIFLIDEDGIQAQLRASTGEAGQRLMEKGHSLAVGSLSVIGQTTFKNEPVIARPGSEDSIHRQNQLLPQTKVEIAFPLRANERVIGALDLQSREDLIIEDFDLLSFQSLANSLSLAIDNIRQFQDSQRRVDENQRLAEQTRSALREVERLNQRLIGRAWSEYLNSKGNEAGLNLDIEKAELKAASRWTATLASAVQTNATVQEGNIIAVPLRVRGEVIGAMEFELNEDGQFTPEDLDLILEVSERFGLAVENTRLLEQSLRVAQRESLINEISSRMQSSTNVEQTLAEAARSLSETLQANKVVIRLGAPDEPAPTNGRGK